MTLSQFIIALCTGLGGTTIVELVRLFLSRRKYKQEAEALRVKNEENASKNEQNVMDYVKKSMIELTDQLKQDKQELREENAELRATLKQLEESNRVLERRVDSLNTKVVNLMNWIMGDDRRYRQWLEEKLHELDPSLEFPKLSDPPNVLDEDEEK